jgi:hypothetical protein
MVLRFGPMFNLRQRRKPFGDRIIMVTMLTAPGFSAVTSRRNFLCTAR